MKLVLQNKINCNQDDWQYGPDEDGGPFYDGICEVLGFRELIPKRLDTIMQAKVDAEMRRRGKDPEEGEFCWPPQSRMRIAWINRQIKECEDA